jgi:hypothetical protein
MSIRLPASFFGFLCKAEPCPAHRKQGLVAGNAGGFCGTNTIRCEPAIFIGGAQVKRHTVLADDGHAELDAFIADEDMRTSDELAYVMLALATEGTMEGGSRLAVGGAAHQHLRTVDVSPGTDTYVYVAAGFPRAEMAVGNL